MSTLLSPFHKTIKLVEGENELIKLQDLVSFRGLRPLTTDKLLLSFEMVCYQNFRIQKYASNMKVVWLLLIDIDCLFHKKIVLAESQNNLMKLLEAVSFRGLRPLTPDKLLPR